MGILVSCLNLPRPPFPTREAGARWGGPAHPPLLHRGFLSPGFGVHHLCAHGGNESWEPNIVVPRLVMPWKDLHKCSASTSEQRPELSSSLSDSRMETTMLLLLLPTRWAKAFSSLQQWPNSAALGGNDRTSDVCLRALENLICCHWAAEDLPFCIFPMHIPLLTVPPSPAQEELGCTAAVRLCYPTRLQATINFWCTTTGRVQNKHIKHLKFASKCTGY